VDMDDGMTDNWFTFKKKIYESAYVRFQVGEKLYYDEPLKRVPAGLGPHGFGTDGGRNPSAANFYTCHGIQDINHYWECGVREGGKLKPVHIMSQQAFNVIVYWPTAAHADPGFGTGFFGIMRIYLVGTRFREVQ